MVMSVSATPRRLASLVREYGETERTLAQQIVDELGAAGQLRFEELAMAVHGRASLSE